MSQLAVALTILCSGSLAGTKTDEVPEPPPLTIEDLKYDVDLLDIIILDPTLPPIEEWHGGKIMIPPETWKGLQSVLEHYYQLPRVCAAKQRAAAWYGRKRSYHEWQVCKARLDEARAEQAVKMSEGMDGWLVAIIATSAALVSAAISGVVVYLQTR